MYRLRFSDLCAEFLKWMGREVEKGTLKRRTLDYYHETLRPIARAIGQDWLEALGPLTLSAYCKTWHQAQCLQRIFNWAVAMKMIDHNPAAKLRRPAKGQRERTLSRSEQVQMLRKARRRLRELLLFLRETICRPGEARAIRWEDWQPAESCFFLRDFKGKRLRKDRARYRVVVLTPRAERLILRLYERACRHTATPTGPVFVNSKGRPWTRNALRLRVRRLCRRLGLDREGEERIVAYTWRHTGATTATLKGVPIRLLAEIMGHTNIQTTVRYQHPQIDDLRAALAGMAQKKCD